MFSYLTFRMAVNRIHRRPWLRLVGFITQRLPQQSHDRTPCFGRLRERERLALEGSASGHESQHRQSPLEAQQRARTDHDSTPPRD